VFDVDRFITDCRTALAAGGAAAVREAVAEAVSTPSAVLRSLGEPDRAGIRTLHRSPELTVLNVVWGPRMCQVPHNHEMWAVIGIYSGREDNIFWRRRPLGTAGGDLEAAGAKSLADRDAFPLGRDIIHSVLNPIDRLTAAIHVYGGDFFGVPRSEWDPERLAERPYDVEKTLARFEESNRHYPGRSR
jgi:predicted metal-dependent enzyme (double-stranded beta helix superfamily)